MRLVFSVSQHAGTECTRHLGGQLDIEKRHLNAVWEDAASTLRHAELLSIGQRVPLSLPRKQPCELIKAPTQLGSVYSVSLGELPVGPGSAAFNVLVKHCARQDNSPWLCRERTDR